MDHICNRTHCKNANVPGVNTPAELDAFWDTVKECNPRSGESTPFSRLLGINVILNTVLLVL
jgi:hypothetical protein